MTEFIATPGRLTIWNTSRPYNPFLKECSITHKETEHYDYVLENIDTGDTFSVRRRCSNCMNLRIDDGVLARQLRIPSIKAPEIRDVFGRGLKISEVFSTTSLIRGEKPKRFLNGLGEDLKEKRLLKEGAFSGYATEISTYSGTDYGFYAKVGGEDLTAELVTMLYTSSMTQQEKARGAVAEFPATSRISYEKNDERVYAHMLPYGDGIPMTFLPVEIYVLNEINLGQFFEKIHAKP